MLKKNITYDILIPPFEYSYDKMTSQQTKQYFDWFIGNIPGRIEYLSFQCAKGLNISVEKLNLSPESLIIVWEWFLKVARIGKTTKRELNRIKETLKDFPESFQNYVLKENAEELSLVTEYIIRDIGMYLGEVFVRQFKNIKWGYYTEPKDDMFINRPVLMGFQDKTYGTVYEPVFEPIHMARVQAANIFDRSQQKEDLFKIYEIWSRYCNHG